MKLLVVDECGYTRLGIASYLADNAANTVTSCDTLSAAVQHLSSHTPSHILLNLTNYCRPNQDEPWLQTLIDSSDNAVLFIYLDAPYPYGDRPMRIADNAFLFNKAALPKALRILRDTPHVLLESGLHSLFSPQELTVMKYWMAEVPNYRIARKLQISAHTVYVHKRHITEKINARNRLEFYSLYNILRYFYPPDAPGLRTVVRMAG
ncbi:LuxR C-terminal-related transcriptional regulator [Serratia rhizosphaerae]|uniref:LuxR family transcriptional regulator n=1 Tax=Serratia rhizosphaerae TaxID=2597702 RepID=A0ABX6GH86_9GAMM|nr:LuxR C-terminal-related transcriptional regulator [Serratia rhizosphaerae]QHA85639.1 LuxR family transcriptional regulator [Serratia rhizosphaerae]